MEDLDQGVVVAGAEVTSPTASENKRRLDERDPSAAGRQISSSLRRLDPDSSSSGR